MSKKSRRRNKKILGALLLGGLGLAARNKRNAAIEAGVQSQKDDSGSDMLEFKEKVVSTPTVTGTKYPGENKARVYPKLKVSDKGYVTKNGVGQGFTGPGKFVSDDGIFVKGKKVSETAPKGILVRKDGTIKANGNEYYNKAQYRTRNDKPGMLGDTGYTAPRTYNEISPFAAKDGGRAKLKSGGKVKGCGKALRGFGRAMKGKK